MPRIGVVGWGARRALAAFAVLALLAGACTRMSSASVNAQPQDLYTAMPNLSDVRSLLGDFNWWPGPPSFGVRPLDMASMPFNQKFSVSQPFIHVGTSETFEVDFELWSSTSAASSHMSSVQSALGTSAITSPKVGDQTIYYGSQGSGAAPFQTVALVRLGPIVTVILLNLKDAFPKVSQLGKIAGRVVSRLKDLNSGKLHGSSLAAPDAAVLPAADLDITLLGSARISVEAALVMIEAPAIDALAQTLRGAGVNDVVYGDYALNKDTRMEVRASVLSFLNSKDANDWVTLLRGGYPADQPGFFDAAHGWYMFPFAAGTKGALLICRSTAASEAASRACEAPLSQVTGAWKLSLGG
jgi:hypothetical protein